MYLKSLELQGFKSFADKTTLEFNKGITAVVGPNGSGKSNIGDSMRWVMGEQSTKTLRGKKMEDIIFNGTQGNGTQGRKKANFAMVTLIIDNADRALNVEDDTVRITRKLYRNGDSEYIINGDNVRLKDITEMFMDTGLGRDGYSIIGQGKIADIVSSKSTDRREIFEEAAGITKFRYKKAEAQRKLDAADENISRLHDIIGELEGRINPLKNQSEKAKKFIVLDEEKRELEISVWVHKLDEYVTALAGNNDKLTSLNEQYEQHTTELDELENTIEKNFADAAQCTADIENLRNKIHETELENSEENSQIAVLENDIGHLNDTIAQIHEQIEKSKSSKYFLETELVSREKTFTELMSEKAENEKALADTEKKFGDMASEAEEFDKTVSDSNNAVNGMYLKKSEYTYKLESAKNSLADAQEQTEQILTTQKELDEKERFASKELRDMRVKSDKLNDDKNEHENRLNGYEKLYQTKNQKLAEVTKEYSQTDIRLREQKQKLNLLKDLENSMEGFANSVKSVIRASKQGRISGVCGSVAQLVSVEPEYSVAVETALGGALQNIIVDDETAAKRGIKLLKETNGGRATFLPLTSVKGRRLDEKNLENEEGFVALGCDIVRFDSKYAPVVNSLLGRICIAEDIELATVIAKKYGYRFKICTLDGQVINAGGSFTGGSVSRNTGLLTRKNEIEKITEQAQKLENRFAELKESSEKLTQEVSKLSAEIDGEKETVANLSNDLLRLEMEIKRAAEIRAGFENQLDDADRQLDECKKRIVESEKTLDEINLKLSQLDKDIFNAEGLLTNSQNKQNEYKQRRELLTDELSSVRIKGTEIQKDIEACQLSVEQLKATISQTDNDSGKLDEQIIRSNDEILGKRSEIESIKQHMSGAADRIAAIEGDITKARALHTTYDNQANMLRSQQKNKMDEKENLQGQISRLEEKINVLNADFDKLVGQLWDDYELTRSDAAQKAHTIEDMGEANRQLADIRNKIKSLGNVNLSSIEEYKEVSERYEFMSTQLGDVLKSKTELEELIDSLTENMKLIFTENFAKINNNFKGIFVELFGGGHGELVLTDPEDVLECGIEIRVAPPGKLIKNLVELSGGEQAFVAIAIYFSILKIHPSPFCLLDEIEAALDDVNVTRYAQYLHKFTNSTQFIAITHRRGTMEEADELYGVTMQDEGVSKMLKMNAGESRQLKLE